MKMEDGESIVGKVEKGFKLTTNSINLRLHLKGDTLQDNTANDIFKEIKRSSYYNGEWYKFLTWTNPELERGFAFLTLTISKNIHIPLISKDVNSSKKKRTNDAYI